LQLHLKSLAYSPSLQHHKVVAEMQVAVAVAVAVVHQSKQLSTSRLLIQQMPQLSTPRVHV